MPNVQSGREKNRNEEILWTPELCFGKSDPKWQMSQIKRELSYGQLTGCTEKLNVGKQRQGSEGAIEQ